MTVELIQAIGQWIVTPLCIIAFVLVVAWGMR